MHHAAAEVEVVGVVVDKVGGGQLNACELPGNRLAESGEHADIPGPLGGQVAGLGLVGQVRCVPCESLRTEGVLGVKVRRGQVQRAALGVLGRKRQHFLGVARAIVAGLGGC